MNLQRKTILTLLLLFCIILLPITKCFAATDPPELTAEGACVLDANTGQVLYEKNIDQKYYPASTTKILTALVVLEHSNLDDQVVIGPNAANIDGTAVGIRATETYSVRDLLMGLILMSGNDCANALAEHVAGSIEEFANLMNEKAQEIGCTNSHFVNPSGLPDENHYTTPRDLATIMRYCIKNQDFIDIARTDGYKLPPSSIDQNVIPLSNHNYVLFSYYPKYYYEYSIASKKGYTVAAQFTNIIAAKKDDTTIIGSFLKDKDINTTYSDVHNIFNYTFSNFKTEIAYSKSDEISSFEIDNNIISLKPSEDIYYAKDITKDEKPKIDVKYELPEDIGKSSFREGDKICTAELYIDDQKFKTIDLISGSDFTYIDVIDNDINSNIPLFIIIAIIFVLILIGIILFILNKKKISLKNLLIKNKNNNNTKISQKNNK